MKEKILQMQWNLEDIINNMEEVSNSGWTSILTAPVQPHKEGSEWWKMYQPYSLSIKNDKGTKEQLKALCEAAHKHNIKIYTDVILTHYANKSKEEELIIHDEVDKNIVNNPYFWRDKKYINYDDRYSITHHCNSLPAIRTENHDYQNLVITFLNELIDCGIDGIRIDSAKMIATPEEFGENNEFFTRIFKNIKKPIYVFGELIFVKNLKLIEQYQKYIDVLIELNENSYSMSKETKEKSIIFAESHDSYNDELIGYTSGWKIEKIINNYEYLVRDFNKVLFYCRPYDSSYKSERIKQINHKYR